VNSESQNEKRNAKHEKRKAKNEKRKTKSEKRKAKNEKRKTKSNYAVGCGCALRRRAMSSASKSNFFSDGQAENEHIFPNSVHRTHTSWPKGIT
jgi:hypothetical protein